MSEQAIAHALRRMADSLSGAPPRPGIAFTALGSELPVASLLQAAKAVTGQLVPIIIGPAGLEGYPHLPAEDLPAAQRIMERLLAEGDAAAAVTLHYNFPPGVATVASVSSLATGRRMVLASTTGSSDIHRPLAMVKNTIAGLAMADALGIEQPSVGILNVEDAFTVKRLLDRLCRGGLALRFADSQRADGGAIMRGNDLIRATPDVMVCDSLTGNLLIKLFSAGQSGGEVETQGCGYGIGLGDGQTAMIGIISRASGPATISQALAFSALMARRELLTHWQRRWRQACACGIASLSGRQAAPAAATVVSPAKTVLDDEIHGIDILQLDEARQCLWRAGIYAETGMGCTGPVLMINHQQRAAALTHLQPFLD